MIRSWLLKISFYAIVGGLFLSGWGLYESYLKRNVDSEVTAFSTEQLSTLEQDFFYAEVSGGVPDFDNTYQMSITKRKGNRELSSYVFTPILDSETGKLSYIHKSSAGLDPSAVIEGKIVQDGLLEPASEVDSQLAEKLKHSYPEVATTFVLDTNYDPESSTSDLAMAGIGVLVFLLGMGGRFGLRRRSSNNGPIQNSNTTA